MAEKRDNKQRRTSSNSASQRSRTSRSGSAASGSASTRSSSSSSARRSVSQRRSNSEYQTRSSASSRPKLQHHQQEQELQVLAGNLHLLQRQKQEARRLAQIHLHVQQALHHAQVLPHVHIQAHKSRAGVLIQHRKIELLQNQNIHNQGSHMALRRSARLLIINRAAVVAVAMELKLRNPLALQSHQKSRLH